MSRKNQAADPAAAPKRSRKGRGKGKPAAGRGSVRWGALAGVALLVPIGLSLLTGQVSLLGAGLRALAVLGAVVVLEALVLPLCRWIVGPPVRRGEDEVPPRR